MNKLLSLILTFLSLSTALQAAAKAKPLPFEKEYRVVLMLPFCIGMPEETKKREVMAQYYEGVEMAIKELEAMGMKMNLIVLDTRQDSLEVIRLLSDPEMQKSDLIIGPVYDNELVEVEKFCATYKIPLVSPLRYVPNTFGADFPLINCNPADSLLYFYTGKNAATGFKNFQAIVVDETGLGISASGARNFKKGFEAAGGKSVKIIDGKSQTPSMFWNGKDSLLIFYTGKSASCSNNGISNKTNGMWLIMGPAEWLNIDRMNYNSLNGIYFYDSYFINNSDSSYKVLRKNYRENYGGEPDRYTIIAYDQFQFFCLALMCWDSEFYNKITEKEFDYTHRTFQFVKRGNLIENAGLNFFYYDNYNFYRANWRY
ncbi:MAG TPA: ABC transporter substrate-binding protein [Bacteroidia bacterium]